jgi:hypothetical protein
MRNLKRAAWAACFLANLILCGCARNRVAAPANDGGTMSDLVFQRLGKVVPGKQNAGKNSEDRIDGKPIVLWHGSTLAAALCTRLSSHAVGLTGEQRIERFDEQSGEGWLGRKRGPFPLVFGSPWSLEGKTLDDSDSFDTFNIVTADVNGDGVDELILPRANGAIAVYSVERELFHHSALDAPKGMRFEVKTTHTAKLKGREVVFFLLALKRKEGHKVHDEALTGVERAAILRVDQRGITRVPLPKTDGAIEEAHAIGGLNRPGSTDIDEILMMFDTGESSRKTYLSRQRPDGSTIAPPKEVYVPINPSSLSFLFLAETTQAMLADRQDGHLYFIRPDKPANWLTDIDLKPLAASPYQIQILQPIEPGADPKVMVAVENRREDTNFDNEALYSVNSEGQCFRPEPAKDTWQPIGKREPFLRLTSPSPDHRFVGVGAQPGTDIVLAVFSREAKMKQLTDDEIVEAAERFLQPAFVAERRKYFMDFGLEELEETPNSAEKERARRGVTERITTVEQWKRLLPQSYQDVVQFKRGQLLVRLNGALQSGLKYAFEAERYRNIDEYKTWLTGLKLGPETVFELIRHGQLVAFSKVAGYLPNAIDGSFNGWPLGFRAGSAGTSVVLPLDPTPSFELEKQRPVFFQVTFPWKAP